VPHIDKRNLVNAFMGRYHELVDNKIGSRIGDRCWLFADLFLREKIAQSMIPFERELLQSYYGKYFARSLDLPLLRRSPAKWREVQKQQQSGQRKSNPTHNHGELKRQRPNDIDDLFKSGGSKRKKVVI